MGRHKTAGPLCRVIIVLFCLLNLFFTVSCDSDNLRFVSSSAQWIGNINLGYAGADFPKKTINGIDDILFLSEKFYLEVENPLSLYPSITYNSMQLDQLRTELVSLVNCFSQLSDLPGEDSNVRDYLDSETRIPNNYFSIPFIYHCPIALPSITARYLDNIFVKSWEKMKEKSADSTTLFDRLIGEIEDSFTQGGESIESILLLFENEIQDVLRSRDRLTVGDAVFSAIFLDFVLSFDQIVDYYGDEINDINLFDLMKNEDFNRVLSYVRVIDYIYKTDFEYRIIKIGLMRV